nr:hypothetical protein GCM10020185_02010 [Pseudomonas brassicacearum subsp. brassicacearum]
MPDQFNEYAGAHPKEGMPLAVTGLTDQQYQTLQRWLAAGAPIDQQALAPSAAEALQVVQWEKPAQCPWRPGKPGGPLVVRALVPGAHLFQGR